MRELLPLAVLALVCGAVLRQPLGCAPRARPAAVPSPGGGPAATASVASFANLEARGALAAPGMRAVARQESAGDKVEMARADRHDECVRVAFEASSPVVARLLDGAGNILASNEAPATDGILGERGPVCVRRPDAVSAVAGGADGGVVRVRWVAWAAP